MTKTLAEASNLSTAVKLWELSMVLNLLLECLQCTSVLLMTRVGHAQEYNAHFLSNWN